MQLSHDRPLVVAIGMGGGITIHRPIPFTAIDAYASRFGVDDPDDFDRFLHLMREMDELFLGHANRKA